MNYEEAVNYFLDIPRFAAKKHDLSGLRRFLEELGNPDRRFKIIHVAGTNGKGSVCAFLESILREQGMRTAAFTSPHLVCVNERFRFDGETWTTEHFWRPFWRSGRRRRSWSGRAYRTPRFSSSHFSCSW